MKFWKVLLILTMPLGGLNAQNHNNYFGVQTHFGQFYRADMDSANVIAMLDSVQAAGIQVIRDECYWADVEKDSGVYQFPKQIDFYIAEAQARGISVLLILDYNNPIYAAHAGAGISSEANRAAFVRYCAATVARYAPQGVKHYEIWNEPNIKHFWDPTPDAEKYSALLQAVYPAIKAIDSTITVLGCATSPAEGEPLPAMDWLTFINTVWQAGGGDYMDGVSFHFYRFDSGPEDWLFRDIENLQKIVGTEKSLWITEIGYPTSTVWPYVSQDEQARYLSRLFLLGRSIPQLRMINYYDLKNDGADPANNEHNFGLIGFDLQPKPGYFASKTTARLVGTKALLEAADDGENYTCTFADATDTVIVAWNKSGAAKTNTAVFRGRGKAIDMLGQTSHYLYNLDGDMDVSLSEHPLYLQPVSGFPEIETFTFTEAVDTLVAGQTKQLNLIGHTADGLKIIIDSGDCIDWSFSGDIAEVDASGLFRAVSAGSGTLTAVFEGQTFEQTITILPEYDYMEIEPFDSGGRFSVSSAQIDTMILSIVDSNYSSAGKALAIDYRLKYQSTRVHRIYFDCDYRLFGEPDSLLIDVFNNGHGHYFRFYVTDGDGKKVLLDIPKLKSEHGWQTLSVPLKEFGTTYRYPVRLTQYILYLVQDGGERDSIYNGQILLDKIHIHGQGATTLPENNANKMQGFRLDQNYPNPFNPKTVIRYALPVNSEIDLSIYDLLGRRVATLVSGKQSAGYHRVEWDGRGFASGVYLYKLSTEQGFSQTRKLLLIK